MFVSGLVLQGGGRWGYSLQTSETKRWRVAFERDIWVEEARRLWGKSYCQWSTGTIRLVGQRVHSVYCLLQEQPPSVRVQSGQSKLGSRHDSVSHNMDIDDAPSASDADVCISATTSSARMASAAVSGGMVSFLSFHTFFTFAWVLDTLYCYSSLTVSFKILAFIISGLKLWLHQSCINSTILQDFNKKRNLKWANFGSPSSVDLFVVSTGPGWDSVHFGSALSCRGIKRKHARHFQFNAQRHHFWTQNSSLWPQL